MPIIVLDGVIIVSNTTTMTDVSTNTDVILVNTVLTFLQYGLNTATVQNVLKVASNTFSMKEVKTAVSMLWKSCDLGNVPNLRGSNKRTQCNAYLEILIQEMGFLISSKSFLRFLLML